MQDRFRGNKVRVAFALAFALWAAFVTFFYVAQFGEVWRAIWRKMPW